ncbi:hypothetical protein C8R45DRAFT_1089908 [Mycena sanguinolenta]|nr:hypothetical protein C8R45DRAFT_1089908 [Mycena sanguinolenta]
MASPDPDKTSIFSYGGENPPDSFNLVALLDIVDAHFDKKCLLVKLDEGGYHKVAFSVFSEEQRLSTSQQIYEIFEKNADGLPGRSLDAVARVAVPAFPCDKLRSEVATLQYIASHTAVPVPTVYKWDADASNPVAAEYMIMQKVSGTPASHKWQKELPFHIKERVVRQVAEHLSILFQLRFNMGGSLYFADGGISGTHTVSTFCIPQQYRVGPVVSDNFYCVVNGCLDYPSTDLHVPGSEAFSGLQALRGPFSRVSDFLVHPLRALVYKCTMFPEETLRELDSEDGDPAETLAELDAADPKESVSELDNLSLLNDGNLKETASGLDDENPSAKNEPLRMPVLQAAEKGIELIEIYPGDSSICALSTPDRPFTFCWGDFWPPNLMIDEATGNVMGLIDLEGMTLTPTWCAAVVPQWIPDPDGDTVSWYGGTKEEARGLWEAFHEVAGCCAEWTEAHEKGAPFREVADKAGFGVRVWSDPSMMEWVEDRTQQAMA